MARVGILVLFLILEEKLSAFHHWKHSVSCGFVIDGLYYFEICSLSAHFLESFYYKWMLNFVKCFFCIYWDDHVVFVFPFVNVVYHADWFVDIEQLLHPRIISTWSWYIILFIYCWIWFASILLRICASIFIRDIGL